MKLLDQAVEWSTDLGMYVMIDWHSIGNLVTGVYQDPMYDTNREETFSFWRAMSRHYKGPTTPSPFSNSSTNPPRSAGSPGRIGKTG